MYSTDQMTAKVIAGQVFDVKGPIVARTPTYYIDFHIHKANEVYEHEIPLEWNSMIVVYKGSLTVQNDDSVLSGVHAASFKPNNTQNEVIKVTTHEDDTRFILLAGKPLNEPIANYGPFVLSNQEQLYQAFDDFQTGKNGFEGARNWRSEIRDLKHRSKST